MPYDTKRFATVAILLVMGLSGGLAGSDAGPSAFADVIITVTTTGAAPAITDLAIKTLSPFPLSFVLDCF